VRQKDDDDVTELVFGETLVGTSDATVKRITFEKKAHDRACNRARAQLDKLIGSYDAVFADRVGKILHDVDVQLPDLPPWFMENAELS
jgi:hypothetical protein